MTRRIAAAIALVLLAFAGGAAAEQFYKWKDANGVWQYSTKPPPAGTEVDRVAVTRGPPPPPPPAEQLDPGAETAAGGPIGEQPVEPGREAGEQIARKRVTACDNARKRYDGLSTSAAVSMDRNDDGVPELLTADQQAEELSKAQQEIGFYCKRD